MKAVIVSILALVGMIGVSSAHTPEMKYVFALVLVFDIFLVYGYWSIRKMISH